MVKNLLIVAAVLTLLTGSAFAQDSDEGNPS